MSVDYSAYCRLCLGKESVAVSIFEGEGDTRQIFLKITACLSVKVTPEDRYPKKICRDCVEKVEQYYDYWLTTSHAEKQFKEWLGDDSLEYKQEYQAIIQPVTDPNTQKDLQKEIDETTDDDENSDDDYNNDAMQSSNYDALPCSEIDPSVHQQQELAANSSIQPPTFVNVLPSDGASTSALQQQKLDDIPEMMNQMPEEDSKSGYFVSKLAMLSPSECNVGEIKVLVDDTTELMMTDHIQASHKTECMDEIIQNQTTMIACALCGDGFISEEDLALHIKSHESLQAPTQPHHDTNEMILEQSETDDEKIVFVCEHCGRSFSTTALMRKHQQQAHNLSPEKIHTCETCEYSSPHKQNVISHERRHNQEYTYNCEECGRGFYTRNTYLEHQPVHSGEKPFQCEICSATFRYRQGLRLHAKLHQPDYVPPQKKHLCELCNKRFSRKQVLLVHMRTHSNAGPQNEYVCHICGKAVSSKTYLTVHVRKHTGEKPHVCDLCNKAFISQNYLSVHRRTHTGERPHKCTHCGKRFTQRTTLVVHLRGHTGDRPYPCTFCHKCFASKTMLNSHLKTHAKQNARAQQEQMQQTDQMPQDQQVEHMHFEELQQDDMVQDELQEQSHTRVLENVSVLLPS